MSVEFIVKQLEKLGKVTELEFICADECVIRHWGNWEIAEWNIRSEFDLLGKLDIHLVLLEEDTPKEN